MAQKPPRQIPFDLAPAPDYSLARFERGLWNRAAFNAVTAWPDWPAPMLLLCGPKGSGKTHLGTAWARRQGGLIVSGRDSLDALDCAQTPIIFFDDAHHAEETHLFTVLNLALNGKIEGLLLASRFAPQDWNIKLPDLFSRLCNTPIAQLDDHDDDILVPIIDKLFKDLGRSVSADVVAYLIKHEDRSIDAMRVLAAELDFAARQANRDVTKSFAISVLKAR